MIRIIAILVGLAFAGAVTWSLGWGAVAYVTEPAQPTAEHEYHKHPKEVSFASDGPLGKFDRQQLQRGFQVYKEVCSACHSMNLISFRNLAEIGYSEAEVKAIADQWVVEQPAINPETGEAGTRKSIPADPFPSPFPNEVAARAANNNALPPDLSLMAKARHNGAAYVYSLLTGYEEQQPAELLKHFPGSATPEGLYYNPYFANLNIAMAPPIQDDQVVYADGTRASRDQIAKDVSAFLVWTAEPKLESRHAAGLGAIIFLLLFTAFAYGAYRNIWRDTAH